jgi:hypothetical protein
MPGCSRCSAPSQARDKNHLKLRTAHRGCCPQRNILRDRLPNTATCQAYWAMGQRNWINVRRGKTYFVLKLNSWTYISVEVSGHNLESSQTWGFRIMFMNSGSWLIRAAKAEQNFLYRADKPNEPIKEGPLSFVLFESTFTSVSTVNRGHPSLVSLVVRQR